MSLDLAGYTELVPFHHFSITLFLSLNFFSTNPPLTALPSGQIHRQNPSHNHKSLSSSSALLITTHHTVEATGTSETRGTPFPHFPPY